MASLMLERVVVQGYKSFRELDLSLERINVLIGPNGSGKSNFIQLFQMMNRVTLQGLQIYVAQSGGRIRSCITGGKPPSGCVWSSGSVRTQRWPTDTSPP
jgi:predicted ATPase